MGLFGNKDTQTVVSNYDFDTFKLSNLALSKDTVTRRLQLTALFIKLKNQYPGGDYTIDTPLKNFAIPEEFETAEIMAIAKYFEATDWHIFLDEERYVDINFDIMEINGEQEMIDCCKDAARSIEKFNSDIDVADFSFNRYPGWLWDKYLEEQYDKMVLLGNKYLTYGDFYVYDDLLDERKITNRDEFEKARNREYILLKSKLNTYRVILVDLSIKQVLATELDDLEKEYLKDFLQPDVND